MTATGLFFALGVVLVCVGGLCLVVGALLEVLANHAPPWIGPVGMWASCAAFVSLAISMLIIQLT